MIKWTPSEPLKTGEEGDPQQATSVDTPCTRLGNLYDESYHKLVNQLMTLTVILNLMN